MNLLLQMFADEANEQPTNEVESGTPTDTENNVESEDGSDVDFDNEQPTTNEEKVENEEEQRKQQNRLNAQRRLEEKKKRETELLKARQEGIIEATGGINKYTGEKLETEEDFATFKLMQEIEKNGDDPVEDFYKYYKKEQQKVREEKENQAKMEEERKQKASNDIADFQNKYPNVNLNQVLENKEFLELFADDLGRNSLATLYGKYMLIQEKINKKTNDNVIKQEAIKNSSTGALGNNQTPPQKSFSQMTREELREWRKNNIRR